MSKNCQISHVHIRFIRIFFVVRKMMIVVDHHFIVEATKMRLFGVLFRMFVVIRFPRETYVAPIHLCRLWPPQLSYQSPDRFQWSKVMSYELHDFLEVEFSPDLLI